MSNSNCRASSRAVKPSLVDGGDGFCHCFYCELTDDQLSRVVIDDNQSSKYCTSSSSSFAKD